MSDVMGREADVVGPDQWEAIALWLRQHPRGPELLDALALAAGNLPVEVTEQLAAVAGRPDAPPALVTVVTGGYIGKLVQVARANAVNIVLSASDVPIPAQLPAVPPDFVNRVAELGRLRGVLLSDAGTGVIAVASQGGTGKSTLAVRFATEVASAFPDGQLYVDLRGADTVPADPAEVLERFLWALGVPADQVPATVDGRQALYRSLLSRRRTLIVLDNASDERQLRPLLPGGTSCLVIITSRLTLGGLNVAERLILATLSPADSVRLLGRLAGADRVAAEPQDAERVARYCGYLPLALHIAGARLRNRPGWRVADLATRLADERHRLDELHVGDLDARSSFALSYRDLDPALARAFRRLSVIPGLDFGTSAAAAVLETGEATAQDVLENLVDMALLETPAAGRYGFHDLIRLFAREYLDAEPGARDAALDRVLTFYRDTAKDWFDRALGEFQPHPDAVRWFDEDGLNVLDAAETAFAHGAWAIVTDLATHLHHLLALHGRSTELQRLLSLAARAAGQSGDARGEVHCTILLAEKMVWRGRAAETLELYERCLLLADQTGDPAVRAWVRVHHGDALRELGEAERARLGYEEAVEIYESLGNVREKGWGLTHLAGALRDLGELDGAERMYREALEIADGHGDTGFRAWIQTHLCWTLAEESRWDEASDALKAALGEHRRIEDLVGQERDLQFLGKLYANRATATNTSGYYQKAAESYREAAEIADRRGDSFAVDEWTRAANWAAGQPAAADGVAG
jgi:tetratricopeptide (TPR) repeat protein